MKKEWCNFFEYIRSLHSAEIAELLEKTDYKSICDELRKAENKEEYIKLADKKATCYYEQAALVALKHFIDLSDEIGIL